MAFLLYFGLILLGILVVVYDFGEVLHAKVVFDHHPDHFLLADCLHPLLLFILGLTNRGFSLADLFVVRYKQLFFFLLKPIFLLRSFLFFGLWIIIVLFGIRYLAGSSVICWMLDVKLMIFATARILLAICVAADFAQVIVGLQLLASANTCFVFLVLQLLLQDLHSQPQSTDLITLFIHFTAVLFVLGDKQLFVVVALLAQFVDFVGVAEKNVSDLAEIVLAACQFAEQLLYIFLDVPHKTNSDLVLRRVLCSCNFAVLNLVEVVIVIACFLQHIL